MYDKEHFMMNGLTIMLLFFMLIFVLGDAAWAQNMTSRENSKIVKKSAQNPVIWADVPDPSVIRVGDTYYMSSTTMHFMPGVPIMKSTNLVNWHTVNYAYDTLASGDAFLLKNGENVYGGGTWASSLRYHSGTFYLVTFSNTTKKTYVFRTKNIESGSWKKSLIDGVYHDPSLFFDDNRAFLVYGFNNIRIIELTHDATALKEGGVNKVLIPDAKKVAGDKFYVPAEGSHIKKRNGYYYVSLISWPAGDGRTQLTYRSERLLGPYTGKVSLQDDGVAQGGLIDTPEGNWYGFLFEDHGAVGRIPMLVPVTWKNNWPLFGVDGKVPKHLNISAKDENIPGIVSSDEFDKKSGPDHYNEETSILSGLSLNWQWNHNPDAQHWSLTERPGYFRLTNGGIDTSFVETRNTLTQRTFGPQCTGTILIDTKNMKDGDYAGLGALQSNYGFVGMKKEGMKKYVTVMKGSPDSMKAIENISIHQDRVYLRIGMDFKNQTDKAFFYYSLNGSSWHKIGDELQMKYTLDHFVGYHFALFNYATKSTGGYVDFDYFRVKSGVFKTAD